MSCNRCNSPTAQLTISNEKAEASRKDHAAKNPPQALPPSPTGQAAKPPPAKTLHSARGVKLTLSKPAPNPDEQEGEDMPMDVDGEPEVNALVSCLAQISF